MAPGNIFPLMFSLDISQSPISRSLTYPTRWKKIQQQVQSEQQRTQKNPTFLEILS